MTGAPVYAVAYSPDGKVLAAGTEELDRSGRMLQGEIRIWETEGWQLRQVMHNHQGGVHSLAFSPDGKVLASGGGDGQLILWDWSEGVEQGRLRGHVGAVYQLRFEPEGNRLHSVAIGLLDGEWVCQTKTWDWRAQREAPQGGTALVPHSRVMSPDGQWYAESDRSGDIQVFEARSGRWRRILPGNGQPVHGMAFSSDNRCLVAGCGILGSNPTLFRLPGTEIQLYDLESGQLLHTYIGHREPAGGLAFAPDGRRFASAGWDGKVMIWSTEPQALCFERRVDGRR